MTERDERVGESDVERLTSKQLAAQGMDATSIGVSSLSLVDKLESPQSRTTMTTLEAETTGTESELSSERGKYEGATDKNRQVIAVSVSKSPSAFFNLARKFLITDEECDLSALEGAIVSAVDAANLLERSKIATIVRIQTSYANVDPKKRREFGPTSSEDVSGSPGTATGPTSATTGTPTVQPQGIESPSVGEPTPSQADLPSSVTLSQLMKVSGGALRRARIVITVKRTADYMKWLEDNPLEDTHAVHDDDHL